MHATRLPVATTGRSACGNAPRAVHIRSFSASSSASRTTHGTHSQHSRRGSATAAAVATHVLAPTTQSSSPVVVGGGPLLIDQLAKQPPAAPAPVVNLTPETYVQFMQDSGDCLVLVDFYTDWCGPCKIMHKEMDKLTKVFPKVKFAKFNCGLYEDFSTQIRVRSLPTFRLYKNCRCLDQVTGAKPVQLRQLLSHYWRPF